MVTKWFSIRNTATTNNTSVSKVAKQIAGAISLLDIIRGGETASLNDCQEEYMIKIKITWHKILVLNIYEVIILVFLVLVVRLAKNVHRLCNVNNLQMPDSYDEQNCCPIRMLGNKSDIFLELCSITNVNSIRIHIGTTMGYPTQFSMSGKHNKGDREYHTITIMITINLFL